MTQEKNKAREEAGFDVAAGGQAKATCENVLQKDDSASLSAQKKNDILASKSTSTEVQLEKALHLLRAGPKTTVELRDHGIMMPAARIHHLRHVDGFHGIGYFCVWQLTTAHRASDQLAGLVRTLGTHPNRLFSPVRRLHSTMVTQQVTPQRCIPDTVSIAWYPRKAANLQGRKESAHVKRILLALQKLIVGFPANTSMGDPCEITSPCRNTDGHCFQLASILSNGYPSRYGEAAAADNQRRGRV